MDLDFGFNEEQLMMRELAQQIAKEKIEPVRAEYDEKQEFSLAGYQANCRE